MKLSVIQELDKYCHQLDLEELGCGVCHFIAGSVDLSYKPFHACFTPLTLIFLGGSLIEFYQRLGFRSFLDQNKDLLPYTMAMRGS